MSYTMIKEEFYDSLDGDLSSASNTSLASQNFESTIPSEANKKSEIKSSNSNTNFLIIKAPPEKTPKNGSNSSLSSVFESKCCISKEQSTSKKYVNRNNDVSTTVPLYSGERSISEIVKARKCCSTSTLVNKNQKHTCPEKSKDDSINKEKNVPRKKRTRNKNLRNDAIDLQQVRSKSYLKIFHSRIGYPTSAKKTSRTDTSRSACGDTLRTSISSYSTEGDEYQDAEDNDSETGSNYFKEIPSCEIPNCQRLNSQSSSCSIYASASCLNMESVSQIFPSRGTAKSKKASRKYPHSQLHPIPVLGGLGPDPVRNQAKMELRKKQLNYGQKASYKNRIKLLEMNILKNLKIEMKESNLEKIKSV